MAGFRGSVLSFGSGNLQGGAGRDREWMHTNDDNDNNVMILFIISI